MSEATYLLILNQIFNKEPSPQKGTGCTGHKGKDIAWTYLRRKQAKRSYLS